MYISQKLTYEQVRKKFNDYVELVKLFKEKYGALKCTHYILLKIVTIVKP